MQININQLIESRAPAYFHSVHEGGGSAAQNSWNAAKEAAARMILLVTEEELEAMRKWARFSGGWEREEIAAWDADELNALFLQLVSAETREAGWDSLEDAEWDDEGALIDALTGEPAECTNIFRGVDGNFYFSLYE